MWKYFYIKMGDKFLQNGESRVTSTAPPCSTPVIYMYIHVRKVSKKSVADIQGAAPFSSPETYELMLHVVKLQI
jgi:hypothetical protein